MRRIAYSLIFAAFVFLIAATVGAFIENDAAAYNSLYTAVIATISGVYFYVVDSVDTGRP